MPSVVSDLDLDAIEVPCHPLTKNIVAYALTEHFPHNIYLRSESTWNCARITVLNCKISATNWFFASVHQKNLVVSRWSIRINVHLRRNDTFPSRDLSERQARTSQLKAVFC